MSSGQPSSVLKIAAPTTPFELCNPSTWIRSVHPPAPALDCDAACAQTTKAANVKARICLDVMCRLDEQRRLPWAHKSPASEKKAARGHFFSEPCQLELSSCFRRNGAREQLSL